MSFDNIPEELRALNQWVVWRTELREGSDKPTKVPYQARKRGHIKASSTDPDTWTSFTIAARRLTDHNDMDGIGFVFTPDDPYAGIDFDGLGDTDPLQIGDFIDRSGTYAEVSPSGEGIHVIGRATLPTEKSGEKRKSVEAYHFSRFFTMTGNVLDGIVRPIRPIQTLLDEFWPRWFPEKPDFEPVAPPPAPVFASDEDILAKIRASKQGAKFDTLFSGDLGLHGGDHSAADLALMSILAFWTQDRDQLMRLFGLSALAQRAKWHKRPDYREMTVTKALERSEFYDSRRNSVAGVTFSYSKSDDGEETETPTFNLTDKGNALRLVYHYGDAIRFCHRTDSWHVWNGRQWKEDDSGEIMRIAMATGETIYAEAESVPSDELKKALKKWAVTTEQERKLVSMERLGRHHESVSIRQEMWDRDPMLLNCANGVVDLRDGSFRPHARNDFLTRIAPVSVVGSATAPTWISFLNRIFDGNADLISFVQRALGYSLTGDITERALFILYGAGRNGKSTLVETVARILGDYATVSSADMVSARKGDPGIPVDLARLQGVRFTMASETGEYSRLDEARVKHITGGDRITARYLHRNPFEFDPQFKIWLSTNYQPTIRGVDEGIWDRIRLIPFGVRIPDDEVDRYLKDKLLREAPGILNWMIEGCLAWQEHGLMTDESVVAATREYRVSQDSVGQFLAECCVMDKTSSIPVRDLYKSYEEWGKDSGEFIVSKRALTNRMRDRGFHIDKMGTQNMMSVMGVRLPFAGERITGASLYSVSSD